MITCFSCTGFDEHGESIDKHRCNECTEVLFSYRKWKPKEGFDYQGNELKKQIK